MNKFLVSTAGLVLAVVSSAVAAQDGATRSRARDTGEARIEASDEQPYIDRSGGHVDPGHSDDSGDRGDPRPDAGVDGNRPGGMLDAEHYGSRSRDMGNRDMARHQADRLADGRTDGNRHRGSSQQRGDRQGKHYGYGYDYDDGYGYDGYGYDHDGYGYDHDDRHGVGYGHGRGYDYGRGYGYGHGGGFAYRSHGYRSYGRYRAPSRYAYPRGYHARSWSIGHRLPPAYYGPSYYVDYRPYGLAPPPYGYRWVRIANDVVLVAIATGLIADIVDDLYY